MLQESLGISSGMSAGMCASHNPEMHLELAGPPDPGLHVISGSIRKYSSSQAQPHDSTRAELVNKSQAPPIMHAAGQSCSTHSGMEPADVLGAQLELGVAPAQLHLADAGHGHVQVHRSILRLPIGHQVLAVPVQAGWCYR